MENFQSFSKYQIMASNGFDESTISGISNLISCAIYEILTMYRQVLVHRSKFACLCSELSNFRKSLSKFNNDTTEITPYTYDAYKDTLAQLSNCAQMFTSLNEQYYISTICNLTLKNVIDFLNNFRNAFNYDIKYLQLSINDPCPINMVQIQVDDRSDCEELLQTLNYLLSECNDENWKKILKNKIEEVTNQINNYAEQE